MANLVIWSFGQLVIVERFCNVADCTMTRSSRRSTTIGACRAQRFRKDGAELARFSTKRRHIGAGDDLCPNDEIEPVDGLFRFFNDDGELTNEIRTGTRRAGRAIVCSDRCRTSCQLPDDDITGNAAWKSVNEPQDAHAE